MQALPYIWYSPSKQTVGSPRPGPPRPGAYLVALLQRVLELPEALRVVLQLRRQLLLGRQQHGVALPQRVQLRQLRLERLRPHRTNSI